MPHSMGGGSRGGRHGSRGGRHLRHVYVKTKINAYVKRHERRYGALRNKKRDL